MKKLSNTKNWKDYIKKILFRFGKSKNVEQSDFQIDYISRT